MNIGRQVAAMRNMTVGELREKYAEVFGEGTRSRHKDFLIRRIAWRMQANSLGGLPDSVREKAREIAATSDVRLTEPKVTESESASPVPFHVSADARLPLPGTDLRRVYKGREIMVKVLPDGFEYAGSVYRSLSAIAREVSGTQWNGFNFFGLTGGNHGKKA